MTLGAALTAALATLHCSGEPSPWVRPRRQAGSAGAVTDALAQPRETRVEYGGCATVQLGPDEQLECIYQPGATLRLWVVHEDGQTPTIAMEGDAAWSMAEPYVLPEEPGQGYRLELTEPGLVAVTVGLPGRPQWRLALRAVPELSPAEKTGLGEPLRRFEELEDRVTQRDLDAVPEIDELLQMMVDRGQVWSAIKSGTAAAYHFIWRVGDPGYAEALLEKLESRLEQRVQRFDRRYPAGAALISTFLGHALRRRGQLAEAAVHYRRGGRAARRIEDPLQQLDALGPYALVLAELGYFEASAYWSAEVRRLATAHTRPYVLAQNLTMLARTSLLLHQARQAFDDPMPSLDEVKRIYGPEGPLSEYREPPEATLSRAEFGLLNEDPREVLAQLEELDNLWLITDLRAHVEELRLRADLQRGASPESLRHTLAEFEALAQDSVGPEVRWKAAVLRGRVFESRGDSAQALEAYEHAEAQLDRMLPLIALGLPGDFSAARRGEGTARLVSLLVDQDEPERAVCAIRRSRARVSQMALLHRRLDEGSREALRAPIERYSKALHAYEQLLVESAGLAAEALNGARLRAIEHQQELEHHAFEVLSEREAYGPTLSCADTSQRQPGELLLVLYPDGPDLRVLVHDDQGVRAYPLIVGYFNGKTMGDHWQSDRLLHPMRDRINGAERIRVLASGPARSIPIHALPWSVDARDRDRARRPLAVDVPVVYGLDLPVEVAAAADERPEDLEALVLADSRASAASEEAARVSSSLRHRGWQVIERSTREQPPAGIRRLLQQVDHFHYAGHAYYSEGGTEDPARTNEQDERLRRWPPYSGGAAAQPSYIPLGAYGSLTIADILMMDSMPRNVVLMGCSTGVVDDRITYGGFSLATAFLAAGSRAVIASTREIEGEYAARFGAALYMNPALDTDPGRWVSEALRSIPGRGAADAFIADYRVYVP